MSPEAPLPGAEKRDRRTPATPGGSPASTDAVTPPPIPDHELIRLIARGSYGEVWLARSALGTWRAVKIVHRQTFWHDHPFEREFKGIQKFEPVSRSHEGLVDILQVGRGEGCFYYVMELADDLNAERGVRNAEQAPHPPYGHPLPIRWGEGQGEGAIPPQSARGLDKCAPAVPRSALRVPSSYAPRTLGSELQARGRLPVADSLHVALTLTSALEHLHRHGLVHRDVKPSNVIFVGGVPKLADIGMVAEVSEARSYVGTEGFIPPEGPGTPQADLYSLGKLLYEISTGKDRHEFPTLPPNLDELPDKQPLIELNAILLKACDPDPRQRHASAAVVQAELELLQQGGSIKQKRARQRRWALVRTAGLAAAMMAMLALFGSLLVSTLRHRLRTVPIAEGELASIFVLPFRYSAPAGEPLDETEQALWLAGRLTDAFIDGLALIPGVSTGPRKSDWLRFEEDEVRRNVFRTNSTRYLLSGRVGKTNDLLRLELRLYARDHDAPQWERTFEGTTNDPIALERRALEPITESLGRALGADVRQRTEQVWARNLEAYRWFLQARRHHLSGTGWTAYRKALECFDRALALDPKYVTAHEGYMELFREFFDSRPPAEVWPFMGQRARTILELDDTSFLAWDRLLDKSILYDRDWTRGAAECDRLANIWPDALISWSVTYRWLGRTNESRLYHERLKTNWPVNAIWRRRTLEHATYGELIWGNYDEAFRLARRHLEEIPENPAQGQWLLARCYLATGQYPQAIDAFLRSGEAWQSPELDGRLGWAYARMGDRARALEYLARLEQRYQAGSADPYYQAWIHAALGNTDKALESLGRAIDYRSELIVSTDFGGLRTDPAWDGMRDDPRFEDLCRKVRMGKGQWPK